MILISIIAVVFFSYIFVFLLVVIFGFLAYAYIRNALFGRRAGFTRSRYQKGSGESKDEKETGNVYEHNAGNNNTHNTHELDKDIWIKNI